MGSGDYDPVKANAQVIYRADSLREAPAACHRFCQKGRSAYQAVVRQLEKDRLELLSFFHFPGPLGKQLRTTNGIECCFVKGHSVDRILCAIVNRFND